MYMFMYPLIPAIKAGVLLILRIPACTVPEWCILSPLPLRLTFDVHDVSYVAHTTIPFKGSSLQL